MRGLRNLSLTLNRAGRYEEALAVSDRLEDECGDGDHATSRRAAVYLNTGRWEGAFEAAASLREIWPEESLVAALAAFEMGRASDATACFLHGALNHPRAARMLLDLPTGEPDASSYEEVTDHNTGVSLWQALHAFLADQSRSSRRFFREMLTAPAIDKLLQEKEEVVRRWHEQHSTGERGAFDRMYVMNSWDFAQEQAEAHLAGLGGRGPGRTGGNGRPATGPISTGRRP
jgi:hypothetical protein